MADCRYDIGLEVKDMQPEGEIGRFEFPAMRVAEVDIRGGIDLEMRAIDWMFKTRARGARAPSARRCDEAGGRVRK